MLREELLCAYVLGDGDLCLGCLRVLDLGLEGAGWVDEEGDCGVRFLASFAKRVFFDICTATRRSYCVLVGRTPGPPRGWSSPVVPSDWV